MSERDNGLLYLLLGGIIVYLFLYFRGKLVGASPNSAAATTQTGSAAPAQGSTCGACGGSANTASTQPQAESTVAEGRYITAIAVPAPSIIN